MLKIWGRENSSNVQKVLWLCAELSLPYERIDAGGAFGLTKEPTYLAMNPTALVPTVEDGDVVLWESNTILRYLAASRGAVALYPTDPAARSHVERWMDWQLSALPRYMSPLLWGFYRTPPEQRDAVALEANRELAAAQWAMLESALGDQPYVAGADFSLADIALGVFLHRWLSGPWRRDVTPRLTTLYDRYRERPWYRTLVERPIT